MPVALHQLVGGFAQNDAVSNQAVAMRGLFRSWGLASDIFCERARIQASLRAEARDLALLGDAIGPGDAALLHLSTGAEANEAFARLPCRKAIIYHNITPPSFFAPVQKQIARVLSRGRAQARALAGTSDVTMADSRFNAGELAAMGFRDVRVMPLILHPEALRAPPCRKFMKRYGDGAANVLFVGRCVPNKKFEDLLLAFSVFQKAVEPRSRLVLAGSRMGLERYHHVLSALTKDLGLRNVEFAGPVTQSELNALYKTAGVFLCMSEHEGFCLPLLESMYHGVPVLAYAAAAVPETMAGAGILFHSKDFEQVAEMMGRVLSDGAFRAAVVARQSRRVEEYLRTDVLAELRKNLEPLLR